MDGIIRINDDLQLTEFQPGDQQNLVRYLNDDELYRNTLTVPTPSTSQDADQWLDKVAEKRALYKMPVNWALRDRHEGVIGGLGMVMKTGLEGHLDELGDWLAAPYRGQGILTTVLRQFADWRFAARTKATDFTYT